MKKVKPMPIIKKDGEVERYNAHYRLNPHGDKEFVIKKKGKDEETLNELADEIDQLLEYMEYSSMPSMSPEQLPHARAVNQSPELVASRGDMIRANGDTITNMQGSTKLASDSPEDNRAKSNLYGNARGNRPRNKYTSTNTGQGLDTGATYNESFTGTAGIASGWGYDTYPSQPGGDEEDEDDEEDDEEDEIKENSIQRLNTYSERNMTRKIDDLLLEYEPEFKAGEYNPGDYEMPHPTGNGVAKRKPKKMKADCCDTSMTDHGDPFGASHHETAAMCDVEESGVEDKPQGWHQSRHGEPSDGHTTKLGHNWPDKPTNRGGGVAEPFHGSRWSDGGTLSGGSGQNKDHYDKGGPGLPKEGPIKGTRGPQMGQPMEWSPELIGELLGEETNIQHLFDSYARSTDKVNLEGFRDLCDAHGVDTVLDDVSLLGLMEANNEYMFYEHNDSDGVYWLVQEARRAKKCPHCQCNPCECEEDCVEESCGRTGHLVTEMQVRSPEEEAHLFSDVDDEDIDYSLDGTEDMGEGLGDDNGGGDAGMGSDAGFGDAGMGGDDLGDTDYTHRHGPGRMGDIEEYDDDMEGGSYGIDTLGHCQGCGYEGPEDECPECGDLVLHDEQEIPDLPQEDASWEDDDDGYPQMNESIGRFMSSARSLIENNQGADRSDIAEALNSTWDRYAGGINPYIASDKVRSTLGFMMKSFPGFDPIRESGKDAMSNAAGKGLISNKLKQSPHLSKQPCPDEMHQHGSKDRLLNHKHKNSYTTTPIMKGTEKGLSGTGKVTAEGKLSGKNIRILRENADKLTRQIKRSIRESASRLKGKHNVNFSIVVTEGRSKNRTAIRSRLAEAVADLEEILQYHRAGNVTLEARFKNNRGEVVQKSDIPLTMIYKRGPVVSEGQALFRFKRNAEKFAGKLMSEGKTCKIVQHNWGSAVKPLK